MQTCTHTAWVIVSNLHNPQNLCESLGLAFWYAAQKQGVQYHGKKNGPAILASVVGLGTRHPNQRRLNQESEQLSDGWLGLQILVTAAISGSSYHCDVFKVPTFTAVGLNAILVVVVDSGQCCHFQASQKPTLVDTHRNGSFRTMIVVGFLTKVMLIYLDITAREDTPDS